MLPAAGKHVPDACLKYNNTARFFSVDVGNTLPSAFGHREQMYREPVLLIAERCKPGSHGHRMKHGTRTGSGRKMHGRPSMYNRIIDVKLCYV
jgi:hypothetical protein